MTRGISNSSLLTLFTLFLILTPFSERAYAQLPWPPFWFSLTPSYDQGKLIYNMELSSRVDWTMTDVAFKIPLPEGTRFLEGNAQPSTTVEFNGQEVTVFTSFFKGWLPTASFVLEIEDPTRTVYTTQAWITWKGDQPGDYLTDEVTIDISRPPLNWQPPASARLILNASATVVEDVITYAFQPQINDWRPVMWDVTIRAPIPEGTTFLSAQAPAPFTVDFEGQEVSFSILQLGQEVAAEPLTFKVSTQGVSEPTVTTHAWATWKNAGWGVGWEIPAIEETVTGDIVAQPHARQHVLSDKIGDVPFAQYDLTSIALQEEGDALAVVFYVGGDLETASEQPLSYNFFIDRDCNPATGNWVGAEYWLAYDLAEDSAFWVTWDDPIQDFQWEQGIYELNKLVGRRGIAVWTPDDFLKDNRQFCWLGETWNASKAFRTTSPADSLPDDTDGVLPSYQVWGATGNASALEIGPALSAGVPSPASALNNNALIPAPVSSATGLEGRIAVPLDNGQGFYDVHIFAVPAGQETGRIPSARQPKFHLDGQRLLVNHEGGGHGIEHIFEYNLLDGSNKRVSDDSQDSHPFYDPASTRIVYGNSNLIIGADGDRHPFLYVQCGLLPPHQEVEPHCKDIPTFGVLVPAGQMGEIWGSQPVWADNEMIVYRGCDSWSGGATCGIYRVGSWATKSLGNGANPRRLTSDLSDTPTDTQGNLIVFMSQREGNWETYVMDLDGAAVKNLSNSPDSNDGLPTLSPDGNWIAFVSDRDGSWAIWVIPVTGGPVQKLFSLPRDNPWGDGDRTWTNERISWGSIVQTPSATDTANK